jgi:hypothetical protein
MIPADPHPHLISEDQLRAWLGYQRRADLERAMIDQRIPILYGRKGQICTTLQAIEGALSPHGTATTAPQLPDFR